MSIATVVDYGMRNLFSVRRSFEHCGVEMRLADSPAGVLETGFTPPLTARTTSA